MNNPTIEPVRPAKHRKRKLVPSEPPAAALMMVAAEYVSGEYLEMTFSEAIDITGLNGLAIIVDDQLDTVAMWVATGTATMISPTTVRIALTYFDPSSGDTITLSAPGDTNITAVSSGVEWAGVSAVPLPFPG